MILVQTFVAGLPRTKGSLAKRPNGTLYDSVVDSGKWRALMAGALRDAYALSWAGQHCTGERGAAGPIGCSHPPYMLCGRPEPYDGAVEISGTFWLPVAPLAYGAGDLDKLLRNTLDALGTKSRNKKYNSGVIVDDNQVTGLGRLRKRGPAPRTGVQIVVSTVDLVSDAW